MFTLSAIHKKQRLVALPFQSGIQPSLRSVVAASQHHGLWGLVFAHGIPVEFMSTSSTRWRDFVTCSTVSRHRTMQTDCMRWTRLLADGSPKGCPQILINRFVLHMLWRFGNKFRQTHVVYVTIIIIRVAVYPKLTSNHEVIQLFSLELPISQVKTQTHSNINFPPNSRQYPSSEIYEESALFVDFAFSAEKSRKEVQKMVKCHGRMVFEHPDYQGWVIRTSSNLRLASLTTSVKVSDITI